PGVVELEAVEVHAAAGEVALVGAQEPDEQLGRDALEQREADQVLDEGRGRLHRDPLTGSPAAARSPSPAPGRARSGASRVHAPGSRPAASRLAHGDATA